MLILTYSGFNHRHNHSHDLRLMVISVESLVANLVERMAKVKVLGKVVANPLVIHLTITLVVHMAMAKAFILVSVVVTPHLSSILSKCLYLSRLRHRCMQRQAYRNFIVDQMCMVDEMDTFVNQMVMVDKMDIFVNQMGMVDKMDIFALQMGMVDEMGTFINHQRFLRSLGNGHGPLVGAL